MPDLQWNRETWDTLYDWRTAGEEWSAPWGTSAAQWFGTILPRIGAFLPSRRVLEIAPGFGRWSRFLLPAAGSYIGVDVSGKCVKACSERFAEQTHARFMQNDGRSLDCIGGGTFDLVFSYDSLVHADYEVIAAYIAQIVPLLSPTGVAFIHHSNLAALPKARITGHRSETVSGEVFEQLVRLSGGRVLIQEIIAWEQDVMSDCYTTFCLAGAYPGTERLHLADAHSLDREMLAARERFQHYLRLAEPEGQQAAPLPDVAAERGAA
jgi:SAM-dependent methyltransferase